MVTPPSGAPGTLRKHSLETDAVLGDFPTDTYTWAYSILEGEYQEIPEGYGYMLKLVRMSQTCLYDSW